MKILFTTAFGSCQIPRTGDFKLAIATNSSLEASKTPEPYSLPLIKNSENGDSSTEEALNKRKCKVSNIVTGNTKHQ